jgi:hypothetical protein
LLEEAASNSLLKDLSYRADATQKEENFLPLLLSTENKQTHGRGTMKYKQKKK